MVDEGQDYHHWAWPVTGHNRVDLSNIRCKSHPRRSGGSTREGASWTWSYRLGTQGLIGTVSVPQGDRRKAGYDSDHNSERVMDEM